MTGVALWKGNTKLSKLSKFFSAAEDETTLCFDSLIVTGNLLISVTGTHELFTFICSWRGFKVCKQSSARRLKQWNPKGVMIQNPNARHQVYPRHNYNNDTTQCLRHVSSSTCLCYTYAVRGGFSEALNTGRSEWKADCAPVRLDFTSEKRQTSEEAMYNAHLFGHSAPVGFTAKEGFSERSRGS